MVVTGYAGPNAGFTGREAELAEITGLLSPDVGAGAVVVSAVAGLAGVGKTALATRPAPAYGRHRSARPPLPPT